MCETGIVSHFHIPDFRHPEGVLGSVDGAVDTKVWCLVSGV